ncbi:MAG: hypothetical protein HKP25_00885 [Marinicaulis sp.]|nr:hypothetical protein [Marinicaulis sp.]
MRQLYFSERLWAQTAFLLLALIPVTLAAKALDPRMINDIPIWTKPLKFQVSLALHFATFAVLATLLAEKTRRAFWLAGFAVAASIATMVEMAILMGQATRGVPSHFNEATVLDQILYALMGIGAVVLILPALAMGVRFLFVKTSARLTPGLKLGAALGLLFGFILTLTLGGYMSMQASGHWVGAPTTDAGGLPIFGWSREGGDLRVAHFFATHLMQALPLIGFLADRAFGAKSAAPRRLVWLAAIVGVGLSVGTFLQALSGQPFIG